MIPVRLCGYCQSPDTFILGEFDGDMVRGHVICRACGGRSPGEWRPFP